MLLVDFRALGYSFAKRRVANWLLLSLWLLVFCLIFSDSFFIVYFGRFCAKIIILLCKFGQCFGKHVGFSIRCRSRLRGLMVWIILFREIIWFIIEVLISDFTELLFLIDELF